MSQVPPCLPKCISLSWGRDRLYVEDQTWIAKIVQEMEGNGQHAENVRCELSEPRSRVSERLDADLRAFGLLSSHSFPDAPEVQGGFQVPEQHGPVAAEALSVFLGLELPAALNFIDSWGRSEQRVTAVHTYFSQCWSHTHELSLCWMFNGYQLYATHHIGAARFRPYCTETTGLIERRLLNGRWVRWGFDGATTLPTGRNWSFDRRLFHLNGGVIQRIDQSASDLMPTYEAEEYNEDGTSPSQEPM